ncbi:MAG: nickel pincer cofactor biosynthesis protein LarC [Endomicrobium sp.]|nr:nickel pincer cofactor biosynthesis protein LarC [Endomicrobium sp.]
MKTLFLECSMGAAGDMITAALFELLNDKEAFLKQINFIGLHNVKLSSELNVKCGIVGARIKVTVGGIEENSEDENIVAPKHNRVHCSVDDYKHAHERNHINLETVGNIIAKLNISDKVKTNASNIYHLIAEAEAAVHGKTINQIHFHEVGNMDAIADIVSVCILMEIISPQEIIVSPINVGGGFAHCAHGALPAPTPATAFILKNVPIYCSNIQDELCTPTGAAIIKYFATHFKQMPLMRIQKIGYGMGSKDFDAANCVRAFLGETKNNAAMQNERIVQLQCNLDDMTGEAIGFAVDLLLQEGALDVFTTPIQMKKNRPAILLTCMCNENKSNFFAELILQHTTTFGVRKFICDRYALKRNTTTQETVYGRIRIKTGEGYNIKKSKPEYDDVAKAANLNGISFDEVIKNLREQKWL